MESLCNFMGIQQKFTKGYCPRENGITERANGTIARILRKKTVVPAEWDRILPTVVYAYNAAPHKATGESPHFLLYGHDPKYPSEIIPSQDLSPYTMDYDRYKTDILCGLKLAREFINEHSAEYRDSMKKAYDKEWKTLKSEKFHVGDRVYVKIPAEKGKSRHPKLVTPWEGPYRIIDASSSSATVTLIGENKPPMEIPFDHLLKIPPQIDDAPVRGKTSRGKKGRPRKAELKVNNICVKTYPALNHSCFRTTFSSTSDVHHVDWHCPGKLMYQGVEVECSAAVPLQDVIPNAQFGALTFSSPSELSRIFAVLSQSHIPDSWRTARLLDRTYDVITPTGLGLAWSFYQQHCIHMTLTTVAEAGLVAAEHPPRNSRDPINLGNVADKAREFVKSNPWTNSSWKLLKPRKSLILLPAGFENVVKCLESDTQKALLMRKPEDVQPEWFTEDYSAIVVFSTAEFAGTTRWRGAWTLLTQAVARGSELIALSGPRNGDDWGRSVDLMRDLFEETIAQRPTLASRMRCFLPLRSQQEMQGVGFRALADKSSEQLKVLTQSAAKRFWTATMVQHSAFLQLSPFRRTPEVRVSDGSAKEPTRRNEKGRIPQNGHTHRPYKPNFKGQHHHGRDAPRSNTSRNHVLERPLQMIGNRMFKLVPVGAARVSKPHGRGGRPHHGWRGPRQFH
ncbi:hypothetical protein Y032_0068g180 [Ancylostoma ceylanicum]|uniref:Integrase catalytic domain-containing protein n=2 Tax=Ancylostoma ceylanicum TaxID=53326 RepID=A0A016TZ32_9BILA|nr:hypothetical protein Y032_0068g180 [Ancylostoma ceylanicum]